MALLFHNQDSCCCILTFILIKQLIAVGFFDRGGLIITQPFDIGNYFFFFLQFILRLNFAPLTSLSYDIIITTHLMRILSSKCISNIHLLCMLHVAECLHGCGIVVWLAKLKYFLLIRDRIPKYI